MHDGAASIHRWVAPALRRLAVALSAREWKAILLFDSLTAFHYSQIHQEFIYDVGYTGNIFVGNCEQWYVCPKTIPFLDIVSENLIFESSLTPEVVHGLEVLPSLKLDAAPFSIVVNVEVER